MSAPAREKRAERDDGRRRRVTGRVNALVASLLVLAIGGMVNYLSYRTYARWDWTSEGYFTLSDRAVQELRNLDEEVELYLLVAQGEPKYVELKELLDRCQHESDYFRVHYVDPDRNISEYRMIVERFELRDSPTDLIEVAAVVTAHGGDRRWTITRDDLIGYDFGGPGEETTVDVKAEQAIIGALVDVTNSEPTKICVTAGHDEWTLAAGSDRALTALEGELRIENVELSTIETLRTEIPADCAAVYVIGPTQPFSPEEADRLGAYVRGGGNAFFALDPMIDRDRLISTGLEDMLGDFGVELPQAIVLEADLTKLRPPENLMGPFDADNWSDHELSAPLQGPPDLGGADLVMGLVRPVRAAPSGGATVLLTTSEHAWGETGLDTLQGGVPPELDGDDLEGPVPLAVAATRREALGAGEEEQEDEAESAGAAGGRIVVIGDADWLSGEAVRDPSLANRSLGRFVTGWLTERDTLISLPPKTMSGDPMRLSVDDLGGLRFRLLVLMPGAMILLGVAMWWSRRS